MSKVNVGAHSEIYFKENEDGSVEVTSVFGPAVSEGYFYVGQRFESWGALNRQTKGFSAVPDNIEED